MAWLYAAGARLTAGDKLARGELNLGYDRVLSFLTRLVDELSGLPLLRMYWYDGTSAGPSPQQLSLAYRSPSRENPSGFLVQEADSVRELSLAEVSSFLGRADR